MTGRARGRPGSRSQSVASQARRGSSIRSRGKTSRTPGPSTDNVDGEDTEVDEERPTKRRRGSTQSIESDGASSDIDAVYHVFSTSIHLRFLVAVSIGSRLWSNAACLYLVAGETGVTRRPDQDTRPKPRVFFQETQVPRCHKNIPDRGTGHFRRAR
ncbi:hypothetical protein M8818_007127 [Zalaria obscura]|uniref:Uncharacterized protein n=1 Tax=Zalaria obscura TaxID=2024903 RepID=A0ACC3S4M9_9PEZI